MAFQDVYIGQPQAQVNPDLQNMTLADLLTQVNAQEQAKAPQVQITPEIWERDIQNGLNHGNKLVADWQTANNIRKPQTMEEQELARLGQFNTPENNENIIQGNTSYKKSFLDNLSQGFNDNYTNPIAVKNFAPDDTKTFSNRLGEGLGTVARFANSPIGRGIISAGIMAAAGGSPALTLGTGLTSAVGRQNAVTGDQLYRNQLKQYGYTDNDLKNIRGIIDSDMYKNLSQNLYRNRQLNLRQELANAKDNTSRARILMDAWKNGADADTIKAAVSAYGIDLNTLGESNQTRNTTSQINYRSDRVKQIDKQLELINKRIEIEGANSAAGLALRGQALELEKQKFNYQQEQAKAKAQTQTNYNKNLSYYSSMPTSTKEQKSLKAQARQDFIAEYGVDPESKLKDVY